MSQTTNHRAIAMRYLADILRSVNPNHVEIESAAEAFLSIDDAGLICTHIVDISTKIANTLDPSRGKGKPG